MLWNDPKHRGPVERGPAYTYVGGYRSPAEIRVIVIHDTEGSARAFPTQPSARAIARWGAGAKTASWHFVVDENVLIRCVPDDIVAWTAPGANGDGLNIEICGYARWSKFQWFKHQATLKRAAWQVARWCVLYNIPPRWLSDRQLRDGVSEGLVTHAQVSEVFKKSDHSDPGPNFPKGYFLWLVKRRIKWLRREH